MSRSLYSDGQFITPKNLYYGETLIYDSFSALFERMVSQFGILLTRQAGGTYSNNALTSIGGGVSIDIQPFEAIIKDSAGTVKQIKETNVVNIDMSNIGTYPNNTYNVLIQKATSYAEAGTITFTYGSNQVVGVGTTFLKNLDKFMNFVIEGSGAGNNNKYAVLSIEDDTHATLQQIFTGTTEGSLVYSVGGRFPDPSFVPPTLSDYRIYQYDTYQVVVTTVAPATGQYRIATVVKAGGAITTVTDKRTADNNYVKFYPTNISGAQIASGVVEANYLPVASNTEAGIVSIAAQTFAGDKTFTGDVVLASISFGDWDVIQDSGDMVFTKTIIGDILRITDDGVKARKGIELGEATSVTGTIMFWNSINGYFGSLYAPVTASNKVYELPDLAGTLVVTGQDQAVSFGTTIITDNLTVEGNFIASNFNLVTVNVGVASANNGSIVFFNNLNAFTTTFVSSSDTSNKTITIPNLTGIMAISSPLSNVTFANLSVLNDIIVGNAGLINGLIGFQNALNAYTTYLQSSTTASTKTITLPDLSGYALVTPAVSVTSPTAPDRTIPVNIAGTTYYIAAKTTND